MILLLVPFWCLLGGVLALPTVAQDAPAAAPPAPSLKRALALQEAGRGDEAFAECRRLLEQVEKDPNADPQSVAMLRSTVADFLMERKEYDQARLLYEQSLPVLETKLGVGHVYIGFTARNLAETYRRAERWDEAEPLLLKALAIYEKTDGAQSLRVRGCLDDLIEVYEALERWDRLEPILRRRLAILKTLYSETEVIVIFAELELARRCAQWGQPRDALPLFREALAALAKTNGEDNIALADPLGELGMAYSAVGEFSAAEESFTRALAIAERRLGAAHQRVLPHLQRLAELQRFLGRYGRAEALLLRQLAFWENHFGADSMQAISALNDLAELYESMGLADKAEAFHRRCLRILEREYGPDHEYLLVTLGNLTELSEQRGDRAAAEALCQRRLKIAETRLGPDHISRANVLANLGMLRRSAGQYEAAETYLKEHVRIYEAVYGADSLNVAYAWDLLAAFYAERRDFERAEALYRCGLELREAQLGPDQPLVASSCFYLADLWWAAGRLADAEAVLKRGIEIFNRTLGETDPVRARNSNKLCHLQVQLGKWAEARQTAATACAALDHHIWDTLPDLAPAEQLNFLRTDHRATLDEALSLARLRPAQDGLAALSAEWVLNGKAVAVEALAGQTRLTRDSQARRLRRMEGELEQVRAERTRLEQPVDPAVPEQLPEAERAARQRFEASLAEVRAQGVASLKQREEKLRQAMRAESAAPRRAALARVRAELAALTLQAGEPGAAATRQERRAGLLKQEETLARELAALGGAGSQHEPVSLAAVRARLPADAVLVEIVRFHIFDFQAAPKPGAPPWRAARYAAWIIPPGAADDVRLIDLGEADALEIEVAQLGNAFAGAARLIAAQGEAEAERQLRPRLEAVARRVLAPLEPHLAGARRWFISADGALWLVPWAALPLRDGRYAVERYEIGYLVTGRDLVRESEALTGGAPVILADPDYDAEPSALPSASQPVFTADLSGTKVEAGGGAPRNMRWSRLPGTAAEAEAVAPLLQAYTGVAPRTLLQSAATESAFKTLQSPRVLVVSTHGFFSPPSGGGAATQPAAERGFERLPGRRPPAVPVTENPLLHCGLVLAGANRRPAETGENGSPIEDGVLTGLEALDCDLSGTELVALSACETGIGQLRNGEGVAGLRQAFQLAGARSVLATLWRIPDAETARLMDSFFRHLAQGDGRAGALRRAQLELLEQRRLERGAAHPFYWAAFTLTGP